MLLKYWTKNKNHSFISLDGEVWGVLPTRTLHHLYPFVSEIQISETQADELIALLEKRAWWMLTDYLAKSEHSEHDCRNYLRKHSFQEGIVDKCIGLCIEKGYLDNRRFAEIYIRSLLERGKSKRAILMKMKEHRLDASVAESLLAELDDGKQSREMLKEQIIKLMRKHHQEEPRKAKEKIYASLYRKGFSLDEIADAWRDLKNP